MDTSQETRDHNDWKLLEEIELASLSAVHCEPILVAELLRVPATAAIRVSKLRSHIFLNFFLVDFLKLLHVLASEDLHPCSHGEFVHSKDVCQQNEHEA